jgi:hypothetical protein
MLLIFRMEVHEYSVKDFVGENRVIVVKVIICSCLFINMESFYCVKINALLLEF